MNENDFLYSRQEKMSEDFGKDLWKQLQEQDKQNRPKRAIWTMVAASFVTSIFGLLLVFSHISNIVPVNMPTFTQHDVITVNNIDELQPFARLGNGMIQQLQVMPDGEHLLVAASTGLFLHDANDLNAEPTQIASDALSHIDVDEQGNIYGITSVPFGINTSPQIVLRWDATTYERTELFQRPQNMVNMGGLSIKPDGSQMMIQMCEEMVYSEYNWRCTEQEFSWYDMVSMQRLYVDHPNIDDGVALGQYAIADDWSYIAYFVDIDDDPETYIYHLQLVDIETREIRTVLVSDAPAPHMNSASALNGLRLSADGKQLMLQPIGMSEQALIMDTVTLWATNEPINFWLDDAATSYRTVENNDMFVHGYTFTPDGRSIFAQSYAGLSRYELTGDANLSLDPTIKADLQIDNIYQSAVFSPDGQKIYGLYANNLIVGYDTTTLEIVDTLTRYDSHYTQEFQFTADGSLVAINNQFDSIPSMWTINSDPPTRELFFPDGELRMVSQFALNPDGMTVAYQDAIAWDKDMSLWMEHLDTKTKQAVDTSLTYWLYDLNFLPDGTLMGQFYLGDLVRYTVEGIFDDNSNVQIDQVYLPGMMNNYLSLTGVSRIVVSPDSQWVVVSRCHREESCTYFDFLVGNIDTEERVTLVTDEFAFKEYGAMAFSPDSQLFAYGYCLQPIGIVDARHTCGSSEVRIYSIDDLLAHQSTFTDPVPLEPLATLTGFDEIPVNIVFNPQQQPDGSWLLAITEWNTRTQLWNVGEDGTANILRVLDTVQQPVAFDPTGGFMFTTADTAQAEVWSVPLSGRTSQ